MSIVLSQKSGKTLVFIREIMEKSGNLFSENGSDPWKKFYFTPSSLGTSQLLLAVNE